MFAPVWIPKSSSYLTTLVGYPSPQLLICLTRLFIRQILKEEVRDLLDSSLSTKSETANTGKVNVPGKPPIQIRESSNGVITLAGSTEVEVRSLKEMASCLEQGSLCRATGSTNMNNQSRCISRHYQNELYIFMSFYIDSIYTPPCTANKYVHFGVCHQT